MPEHLLGELVPVGGGDPIPLLQSRLSIGRRSKCDIVLEFPNVSSEHCELELREGYWHIRDTRSRNGIKVNGERVTQKFLHPGDELSIAKHRYEIQYQATGPAPIEDTEESRKHPFGQSLLEKAGLVRPEESEPPRRRRQAIELPETFDVDEEAAAEWLDE